MLTGFFRGIASMGAPTVFEKVHNLTILEPNKKKARLNCTYKGDCEPPDEEYLTNILQAMAGKDNETRPEVAFRTLIVKLQYSESLKKWNYIVKNLIILDRMVEEKYFLNDISELDFDHLKNYKDEDPTINNIQINGLIQHYFFFIVEKAKIYKNKGNVFNVERNENNIPLYLKFCNLNKLLIEVNQIQYLNTLVFETAKTGKKGYLQYNVNQYVYILLLSVAMNYYTLQYLSIILLLDKIFTMNLEQAQKFKELYLNFIKLTGELVTFIKTHQFIKGFQISTSEFYKSDAKTITIIEEYINHLSSPDEKENKVETLELTPEEVKDLQEFEQQVALIKEESSKSNKNIAKQEESKAFSSYENAVILGDKNQESNKKAREEIAKLVGSNISPSKIKKQKYKKTEKKLLGKPILVLGIVKNEEKTIEEDIKLKYQESFVEDENLKGKNDYSNLVDMKNELPQSGKLRKPSRRVSNAFKLLNNQNNFQPDFDPKLFESFFNGYSFMFSVEGLNESKIKDDIFIKH